MTVWSGQNRIEQFWPVLHKKYDCCVFRNWIRFLLFIFEAVNFHVFSALRIFLKDWVDFLEFILLQFSDLLFFISYWRFKGLFLSICFERVSFFWMPYFKFLTLHMFWVLSIKFQGWPSNQKLKNAQVFKKNLAFAKQTAWVFDSSLQL